MLANTLNGYGCLLILSDYTVENNKISISILYQVYYQNDYGILIKLALPLIW